MVISLRGYAGLSIAAAIITIGMKSAAYALTGSAGLLSDALESLVNLVAALTAYFSVWYAARPVDSTHTYGHEKIEFFAAGLEGACIIVAGLGTIAYGIDRLFTPHPLSQLELGIVIALAASMVNLVVARILLVVGRKQHSVVLEADGHHLMTDVYTSFAVVGGLILVRLTGVVILDPVLALLVGGNILVTGFRLIRRSFDGLMDRAIDTPEQERLRETIRQALPPKTAFHAMRTRRAGARIFADFHLLVPGRMSVSQAHAISHQIEAAIRAAFPAIAVTIHIEPIDEGTSWEAEELARLGETNTPKPHGQAESP